MEAVEYCQNIPNDLLQIAAENKGGKPINVTTFEKNAWAIYATILADWEISQSKIDSRGTQRQQSEVEACNMEVHEKMMGDWMRDYEPFIPEMLENGVRGMIYAGESDFICNFAGNLDWTRRMEWSRGAELCEEVFITVK